MHWTICISNPDGQAVLITYIVTDLWLVNWLPYMWSLKAGYTLFANHSKMWMKWKFRQKNCKFAKHDENHATHDLSIVQSFAPESDFFSLWNTMKTMLHMICRSSKVLHLHLTSSVRAKNPLSSSWRPLAWWNKTNRISWKTVMWNATNHLLHTIRSAY